MDTMATDDKKEDEEKYFKAGFTGFYRGKRNETAFGQEAFHVNDKWAKTRTAVDKKTTGHKLIQIFGLHASEARWALPLYHPRHLLQFPLSILTRILSFCLVTDKEVTPLTVSCNRLSEFQEPSYTIGITGDSSRQTELVEIQGVDYYHKIDRKRYGNKKYYGIKKYSGYFRKPIDATILRVCKLFYREGLPLLYGDNEFVFDLQKYHDRDRHKQLNQDWVEVFKNRSMPRFADLDSGRVQNAISDMISVKDPEALDDWIYCDPFARFLHSIGPKNAAMIRKLRFTGDLFPAEEKEHLGRFGPSLYDEAHNIGYYLKAYAPFLIKYCPNLKKLGIGFTSFFYGYWDYRTGRPSGFPASFVLYPEDEEVQDGDELIENDVLEIVRAQRRENRMRKVRKACEDYENGLALNLKPFLDTLVPKLKNLQVLEVKRPPPPYREENTLPTTIATWKKFTDTIPWLDMEMANEAKTALSLAVLKRSQEMEAAKKMASPTLPETAREAIVPSNSKNHSNYSPWRPGNGTWSAGSRGGNMSFPQRGRGGTPFRTGGRHGWRGPGNGGNPTRGGGSSSRGHVGSGEGHSAVPQALQNPRQDGQTLRGAASSSSGHNTNTGSLYRGRGNQNNRGHRGHRGWGGRGN